jgi:endonuclease/exonuclease/phosphatase (EEP) superfamily protein YafD
VNIWIVIFSFIILFFTMSSFSRHSHWLIRFGDFPRLQIIFLLLLANLANIFILKPISIYDWLFTFGLLSCLVYQVIWILPLTVIYPKEVQDSQNTTINGISVLTFNILMHNRNSDEVLKCVREIDPDIILLAEPNKWWAEKLTSLTKTHPFVVSHPLENCYGMMLFSKLELVDANLQFLIQPDIPSIHTKIRLHSGKKIRFHGLHPRPPSPIDKGYSTERDGELLLVAKAVAETNKPTIVAGDLNDVTWSETTRLFKKISGLLDPRVGRGFFNSFHAKNLLFRFPLDHIFHTDHFRIVEFKRINKTCGSDHFPIFVQLNFEENILKKQKRVLPTIYEIKQARMLIAKALTVSEQLPISMLNERINILKLQITGTD